MTQIQHNTINNNENILSYSVPTPNINNKINNKKLIDILETEWKKFSSFHQNDNKRIEQKITNLNNKLISINKSVKYFGQYIDKTQQIWNIVDYIIDHWNQIPAIKNKPNMISSIADESHEPMRLNQLLQHFGNYFMSNMQNIRNLL